MYYFSHFSSIREFVNSCNAQLLRGVLVLCFLVDVDSILDFSCVYHFIV